MNNLQVDKVLNDDRLILRYHQLSISADFLSPRNRYRWQQATIRRELLAKAVGMTSSYRPIVIDATAGLGRDGFLLAILGCYVHLLERCSFLCDLLRDGLDRVARSDMANVVSRIQLICDDSVTYLRQLVNQPSTLHPDVVYLDPMFPKRQKRALARKEMQVLQALLPVEDDDANHNALLEVSRDIAVRRVVVKRPRFEQPLAGCQPSFSLLGRSNRFDVYCKSVS